MNKIRWLLVLIVTFSLLMPGSLALARGGGGGGGHGGGGHGGGGPGGGGPAMGSPGGQGGSATNHSSPGPVGKPGEKEGWEKANNPNEPPGWTSPGQSQGNRERKGWQSESVPPGIFKK